MIIPLVTTPYLSRVLGRENIGIYSYIASVTAYFTLFATFGFHTYGQRQIAYNQDNKEKNSEIFAEVMADKFIFTAIALLLYTGIVIFNKGEYRIFFTASGLLIVSTFFDLSWFFQGIENFKIIFIRSMVLKIGGLIFIFSFVRSKEDLAVYIFADSAANFLGNISVWPAVIKHLKGFRPKIPDLRPGLKISAELFVPMIAIYIYSLADRTMLGLTGNKAESGVYEQAHKILRLLEMILVSLSTVLIPRISFIYKNENINKVKDTIDKAYKFIIFLGMPISFGLFAVADNMVPWFFGDGYEKVAVLLKMSSPIILVIGMANIAGNAVLIPIEEHNKTTMATMAGAAVNIVLNSVLIGVSFSTGAMTASIIAETIVCVIEMFFARKYLFLKNILKYIFAAAFISAIMYMIIMLISRIVDISGIALTIVQVLSGAAVYGVLFLILKNIRVIKK